jgi:hypothetical protein
MVMRITLLRLPFAQSAFAVAAEPLWLRSVLAEASGQWRKRWLRASLSSGNRGGNAWLDRTNPEVEIEAQRGSRGEDRPCDCCRSHVKVLPCHATLLSDQMLSAHKGNAPVALRQGVSGDKAFK